MSSIGRREFLATTTLALTAVPLARARGRRRLLYVAEPGIRNYVDYGGVGVLVFDVDANYRFVRRIPTWDVARRPGARERQGHRRQRADRPPLRHDDAAHRVLRSPHRAACCGTRQPEGGCDRLAISPDGSRSTCRRSRGRTGTCSTRRRGDVDREDRHEFRRAQHDLCGRRPARLSGGPPFAPAVDCRSGDAQGREDGRPVLELDPSVHGQRGADALLRQRQRAARLRGRRPHDRARSCTASRCRASDRARSSGTAVRATASA